MPSRGGNVAKAFIKIIRLRNCIYRGLGRCPSSQYAFSLAHAYSARLRFYGHVLLILKKSSIFREPYPSRRLYLCNRDSHHSKLIFRRGRLPRRPVAKLFVYITKSKMSPASESKQTSLRSDFIYIKLITPLRRFFSIPQNHRFLRNPKAGSTYFFQWELQFPTETLNDGAKPLIESKPFNANTISPILGRQPAALPYGDRFCLCSSVLPVYPARKQPPLRVQPPYQLRLRCAYGGQ